MTQPTSDDPFPPQFDASQQEQPPPFEDMATFTLTKPVELTQLRDEIMKAVSKVVELAQTGPNQPGDISPSNPAELAVTPSDVDKDAVQAVIDAHEPIADYGVPESYTAFLELLQRVVYDPEADLTDDDVRVAVRGLLQREANRQQ